MSCFEDDLTPCLKALIQEADADGVKQFLALHPRYDVPPRLVNLAAALPFSVANRTDRESRLAQRRDVLVAICGVLDEGLLKRRIASTDWWEVDLCLGRGDDGYVGASSSREVGTAAGAGVQSTGVTVLHQFCWAGDEAGAAHVLQLPACTRETVNSRGLRWVEVEPDADAGDADGETPLHLACMAGRPALVRLLLRDGRADPNLFFEFERPLVSAVAAADALRRRIDARLADCVRALVADPRTEVRECWYRYGGAQTRRHVLHKCARYGHLEMAYLVLQRLPDLDIETLDKPMGLVEMCARGGPRPAAQLHSCFPTLMFLIEVANAGCFRNWRAEKTRELCEFRASVLARRRRKRPRGDLTMAQRLLRAPDDVFAHVLGFCWLLDPGAVVPSSTDYDRVAGRVAAAAIEGSDPAE